jgi:hypothetical protein
MGRQCAAEKYESEGCGVKQHGMREQRKLLKRNRVKARRQAEYKLDNGRRRQAALRREQDGGGLKVSSGLFKAIRRAFGGQ